MNQAEQNEENTDESMQFAQRCQRERSQYQRDFDAEHGLAGRIGQREQAAAEFGKAYQGLTAESGDYRRLVGMKLNALGIDPDAGAKAGAAS